MSHNLSVVSHWPELLNREDVFILDCETTGLSKDDECVEIGIIDTMGRQAFYSLLMPIKNISLGASATHGHTRQSLEDADAPYYPLIHDEIMDVLDLLAHALTREQILSEHPDLEPEDIRACLRFASDRLNHPVLAA